MYNFDMLGQFNHGDLAALACPRPFMVEAGTRDPVLQQDWVESEFAYAKRIYAAQGQADQIELVWRDGAHCIFAQESFEFLRYVLLKYRCSDSKLGRRDRARAHLTCHVHDLPAAIPKANLKTYR